MDELRELEPVERVFGEGASWCVCDGIAVVSAADGFPLLYIHPGALREMLRSWDDEP